MKITEDFSQNSAPFGRGIKSPGCSEHHRHDQEASSRMDSEGCPNWDNEDDTLAEELSQDADTPPLKGCCTAT
jgi:hypothetical protein